MDSINTDEMVLISSNDFEEYVKGREEDCIAEYNEAAKCNGWEQTDLISHPSLMAYFDDQMALEYECFFEAYEDTKVLIEYKLGLWNRSPEGRVFGYLGDFLERMIEDDNYIYFNPKDGSFVFKAVHHDGTNWFIIHKLTKEAIANCSYANEELYKIKEGFFTRFEYKNLYH